MLTNDHAYMITYAINLSTLSREYGFNEPAIARARVRYDAERMNLSAQYAALRDLARADHADRVADHTGSSLSHRAQDYGIVPHKDDASGRNCCTGRIAINRAAAGIISEEIGNLPRIGLTMAAAPAPRQPLAFRSAVETARILPR